MKNLKYHLITALFWLIAAVSFAQTKTDKMFQTFQIPPADAKPKIWWRWMGGQVSRTGITQDMEALKKTGFGGVLFFQLDFDPFINITSIVTPEIKIFSSYWWSMLQFEIKEAKRCSLEFAFQNTMGFSTHSGP